MEKILQLSIHFVRWVKFMDNTSHLHHKCLSNSIVYEQPVYKISNASEYLRHKRSEDRNPFITHREINSCRDPVAIIERFRPCLASTEYYESES